MLFHFQAIESLERRVRAETEMSVMAVPLDNESHVSPVSAQVYCMLGHLNLLLENYPKGELKIEERT